MKQNYQKLIFMLCFIALANACSDEPFNARQSGNDTQGIGKGKAKSDLDAPILSCSEAGKSTITLTITAGASGAAAGFSIQWMTAAAYTENNNTWYASEDSRLCKASFSGNANSSRYALEPHEAVDVTIGELELDNGASTSCADFLDCGTAYVFRAFAHASSTLNKSSFSPNQTCSTADCDGNCTYGQGYWKNHPDEWPVEEMQLGSNTYSKAELIAIYAIKPGNPISGNGLIFLAYQLIAAKLNVANNAILPPEIAEAISEADQLIGDLNVLTDSIPASDASALTTTLDNYNKGYECGE